MGDIMVTRPQKSKTDPLLVILDPEFTSFQSVINHAKSKAFPGSKVGHCDLIPHKHLNRQREVKHRAVNECQEMLSWEIALKLREEAMKKIPDTTHMSQFSKCNKTT
jgi:hypothetical protein